MKRGPSGGFPLFAALLIGVWLMSGTACFAADSSGYGCAVSYGMPHHQHGCDAPCGTMILCKTPAGAVPAEAIYISVPSSMPGCTDSGGTAGSRFSQLSVDGTANTVTQHGNSRPVFLVTQRLLC